MGNAFTPITHPNSTTALRAPSSRITLLYALALLVLLNCAYLFGSTFASPEQMNCALPLALLFICILAAGMLMRSNPVFILSPFLWFLVTGALYWGCGPLVYHYGNAESVRYLQEYYAIDEEMLFRTNRLNAVYILCVSLTFCCVMGMFPSRASGRTVFDKALFNKFIKTCLLFGGLIRYIIFPLKRANYFAFYVPEQFLTFSSLILIAIVLMTLSCFRGEKGWSIILWPLVLCEVLIRLIGGYKIEFYLVLMAIFLGVYLAQPRWKTLAGAAGIIVISWFVIIPITNAVRINRAAGERDSLIARASIALSVFNTAPVESDELESEVQGWWTRLCYSSGQAFCIDSYDNGAPGDSMGARYVFWSFVPRALFPNKPEMTLGQSFNASVTGNAESLSAPGVFGEAYWNGGWSLVLIASTYVGVLFAVLTRVAIHCISASDFRWLPLVWCGIMIGLRPDDWFVPTFIGGTLIACSTCIVLHCLLLVGKSE